jgi:bile acid-coenzyme A ligase
MAEVSFGERLTHLAREKGESTALVFAPEDGKDLKVSWTELERRANQVARFFAERGVEAGSTVAVALRNSTEHVQSTFGAWKLGASVLPLRYDLPTWERDRILELAQPSVVVGDWNDDTGKVVSCEDLARTIDRDASSLPDKTPARARMIATSGSTGRPKLIVSPSPGVWSDADTGVASAFQAEGDAVHLTASPMYHTNGQASSYMPLLAGDRIVVMERFDAERAVDSIERHQVTHLILVPTMLQRIARLPDVQERDFSSVRRLLYGGASIPEWVVRAWLNLVPPDRFFLSYGGSEGIGICMTTGTEWLTHPGTTGRPVGCDLKILDDDGNEVPTGEVGEIFMLPHNQTGPTFEYIGSETPRPTADGFQSYGDMGWVDEDGFLYISDRRQDMIVTGGANVFPAEVEAALSEHPEVEDVVVIGLPDPEWGRRVHAIIQPSFGASLDSDSASAYCKERLSSYKVPKTFEFIEEMPRTGAGKVNRSALAAERSQSSDAVAG